jgi:hypothetical protein
MAAAVLFVVAVAPAALAAPADGNGNKDVDQFEFFDIPIFCDETDEIPDLSLDVAGFIQFKEFDGEGNPNLELAVFHIDATFSNSDGDSWTWRDRGPDRSYVDSNGDVILTITGRSGANNIGHVVLNLTTGEILLQAGTAPFGGELFEKGDVDYACETLVD